MQTQKWWKISDKKPSRKSLNPKKFDRTNIQIILSGLIYIYIINIKILEMTEYNETNLSYTIR